MDLTVRIKNLILENNLDYVGFAPIERFNHFPQLHKPDDFLPDARSVIVMGMKLSLGVQLSNMLAHRYPERLRHAIYPYLWYGLGLPNLYFLDTTAVLICKLIEKENQNYTAVPIPSFSPFDLRDSLAEFSNAGAAAAAGLAQLGWNGFALTPDAGPRVRFTSVITNVELEYNSMYKEATLCNPNNCSYHCVKICPVNALAREGEEINIGGEVYNVGKFDKWRCLWCSLGLTKDSLCLLDSPPPIPEKLTFEDVFKALRRGDAGQASEVMVIRRGDYCGKCIMECPVGESEIIKKALQISNP